MSALDYFLFLVHLLSVSRGFEAGVDGQDEAADSWREASLDIVMLL